MSSTGLGSTAAATSSSSQLSKAERIVGGFASLLSSALTLKGDDGNMEPLKNSSTQLQRFISPHADGNACCVVPTLMLKQGETQSATGGGSTNLQETAALNLAKTLELSVDVLEAAPMALLANLCESFSLLIDSRLRSSIAALVRQSQFQKDATLTRVLVGLLACSESPISPTTVVTSFRVLSLSDQTPRGELVMPLVMETIVDLTIFGNLVNVTLVAPGTIQAYLCPHDGLIQCAEVVLDTVAFLQSMMKQARFAVRKAVAIASNMATKLLIPSALPDHHHHKQHAPPHKVSSSKLSTSNLKLQLMQHQERQQEERRRRELSALSAPPPSKDRQSSVSLMPPPPRRPSRASELNLHRTMSSSSSFAGHGGSKTQLQKLFEGSHNATWDDEETTTTTSALQHHHHRHQERLQRNERQQEQQNTPAPSRTLSPQSSLFERSGGLSLLTTAAEGMADNAPLKRKINADDDDNGDDEPTMKRIKMAAATAPSSMPSSSSASPSSSPPPPPTSSSRLEAAV